MVARMKADKDISGFLIKPSVHLKTSATVGFVRPLTEPRTLNISTDH